MTHPFRSIMVSVLLALACTFSVQVIAGAVPRGIDFEDGVLGVPDPDNPEGPRVLVTEVTSLEIVRFTNEPPNDPAALLVDFTADGSCVLYTYDNSLPFGYVVFMNIEYVNPVTGEPGFIDDSQGFFFDGSGDNSPTCNVASVEPVTAVDDNFGADYEGRNVLDNDTLPDGRDSVVGIGSSGGQGLQTIEISTDGSFSVEPEPGFTGNTFFEYFFETSSGEVSNVASVSLTIEAVAPPNSAPVAIDDDFGVDFEGRNVLDNDTDPDGDSLIAILVDEPSNGVVELNEDGTFTYTAASGTGGQDTFTYKARDRALDDPDGLESDPATVTLGSNPNDDGGDLDGKVDDDGYSVEENATDNELETSTRIDEICPRLEPENSGQEDLSQLCSNLRKQGTTARETVAALDAITPEEFSSQRKIGRETSLSQFRNVAARIEGVRRGASGVSIAGLKLGYDNVKIGGHTLDNLLDDALTHLGGGASADQPIDDFGNLGIFVRGDLNFGEQDESEREAGFDYDAQMLTFGADYRFTNNFFAGLSASVGQSDVDFDKNQGDVKTDNYAIAAYASWYSQGDIYLDGILSYGWSDIDSKRNIVYEDFGGSVDRTAKSGTDGDNYYFSVNAGYGFNWGALLFDPSVRFYYMDGSIDGFSESGADGWDLAFEDQDYESMTLSLGGQLAYSFTPSWGVVTPYIRAEYTREFEDNAEGVVFRFVNDPFANEQNGGNITVTPEDPESTFLVYGAGVSAQLPYGLSGFVSYSILGSYENLNNETVSLGMRWETTF